MRRAVAAIAVVLALAFSAGIGLAKGPIPKGAGASIALTASGSTCSGTLTIFYNTKPAITEIRYTAIQGNPSPYGAIIQLGKPTTRYQTDIPFTWESGTSVQFQVTFAGYAVTQTNTLSCP